MSTLKSDFLCLVIVLTVRAPSNQLRQRVGERPLQALRPPLGEAALRPLCVAELGVALLCCSRRRGRGRTQRCSRRPDPAWGSYLCCCVGGLKVLLRLDHLLGDGLERVTCRHGRLCRSRNGLRGLGYRAEVAGGGLDCLLGLLFQLSGAVDKPGTLRLRAELLGVECEDDVTEGADRGDRGLDLGRDLFTRLGITKLDEDLGQVRGILLPRRHGRAPGPLGGRRGCGRRWGALRTGARSNLKRSMSDFGGLDDIGEVQMTSSWTWADPGTTGTTRISVKS